MLPCPAFPKAEATRTPRIPQSTHGSSTAPKHGAVGLQAQPAPAPGQELNPALSQQRLAKPSPGRGVFLLPPPGPPGHGDKDTMALGGFGVAQGSLCTHCLPLTPAQGQHRAQGTGDSTEPRGQHRAQGTRDSTEPRGQHQSPGDTQSPRDRGQHQSPGDRGQQRAQGTGDSTESPGDKGQHRARRQGTASEPRGQGHHSEFRGQGTALSAQGTSLRAQGTRDSTQPTARIQHLSSFGCPSTDRTWSLLHSKVGTPRNSHLQQNPQSDCVCLQESRA